MACWVRRHAARIRLLAGQVDERPNAYQGRRDFTVRIEDLAVTHEQDRHPAATRTGVPVRVPRVPPCDREESSACHALPTSRTGTNGRAWPRRAVSARTRFITNSDAVRVAGRATSKRPASSTLLVRATPAIASVDQQRRERPVGARVTRHGTSSAGGIAVVRVRDRRCLLIGDIRCRCSRARGNARHSVQGCGPCAHASR